MVSPVPRTVSFWHLRTLSKNRTNKPRTVKGLTVYLSRYSATAYLTTRFWYTLHYCDRDSMKHNNTVCSPPRQMRCELVTSRKGGRPFAYIFSGGGKKGGRNT